MPYDKKIFDSASKIIFERRAQSLRKNEDNRAKLFLRYPKLKELDNQIAKQGIAAVTLAVSRNLDESSYANFSKNTDKLNADIAKFLDENNLPKDALSDKFECAKCEDTGFDGKNLCVCLKSEMKKLQVATVNKISPLTLSTFDNFSLDFYSGDSSEVMAKNLNYCKKYVDNFINSDENLLFIGNTGLGKTHLSLAIANSLIEKGKNVIYTSWLNILTILERERFQGTDNDEYTIDSLIECELLILDDLGAEFTTQFSVATLYNILNSRINYRKPTIINTNLIFKELGARYSDRIVSRIAGNFTTLRFSGNDIRIAKKKQN